LESLDGGNDVVGAKPSRENDRGVAQQAGQFPHGGPIRRLARSAVSTRPTGVDQHGARTAAQVLALADEFDHQPRIAPVATERLDRRPDAQSRQHLRRFVAMQLHGVQSHFIARTQHLFDRSVYKDPDFDHRGRQALCDLSRHLRTDVARARRVEVQSDRVRACLAAA
jgi:hypothetical protein